MSVAVSKLERRILSINLLGKVALITFFVFLTALSSKVRIYLPFSPVPVTLQTFSVILSGIILKEVGAVSQIVYMVLGLLGLNLFAKGGGLSYVTSSTFGYVVGFVFASFVAGYFTRKYSSTKLILLGVVLANAIIYLFGLVGLYAYFLRVNGVANIIHLLQIGVFPFVPFDIVKIIFAFGFAKFLKKI